MEPTHDTPIKSAYIDFVLKSGQRPGSVMSFSASIGMAEREFYQEHPSFEVLEATIFKDYFLLTMAQLEADEEYAQYDVGTKLLSIYYTWLAVLNENRSMVKFMESQNRRGLLLPTYQTEVKEEFADVVRRLLKEGMAQGEFADRWMISRYYKDAIWLNARFVLDYWLHDQSRSFERTDAAVEKSVRVTLDLIRPNVIDSGLDLIRFLVN